MALSQQRVAVPRRGRPPIPGVRATILHAAAGVFARRSYHAVLMDEVAGASRVGKGTIYRYFPSKRDLFLAVTFDGIEQLQADLDAIAAGPGDAGARLARLVERILGHFWDRRVFFALVQGGEGDDPGAREWLRRRVALARVVQRTLAEGVAAGVFRPVEPRLGAEMLLGMLRGANRYRSAGDRLDRVVAMVLDVFLHGVCVFAPGRGAP
jgi:AcrR family transcriptional regulator